MGLKMNNFIYCGLNIYIRPIIKEVMGYKYKDYEIINKSLNSSKKEVL